MDHLSLDRTAESIREKLWLQEYHGIKAWACYLAGFPKKFWGLSARMTMPLFVPLRDGGRRRQAKAREKWSSLGHRTSGAVFVPTCLSSRLFELS